MIDYSFGPRQLGADRFEFRLWAPSADPAAEGAIRLHLLDSDPIEMAHAGDGWYAATATCKPGARYRFSVSTPADPEPRLVNDPASRLQDGDVHDPSVVTGSSDYVWRCPDWGGRPWNEAVIYELHVGLCGGFNGVAQRLTGIAELGFTAVELMPIGDFPGARNWGYDGVLPYAPDATYGTPDELRALVDRAHELGLMVLLDVVYNHFGPDGNFLHCYARQFFNEDIHTPWGAAIDFRQKPVRAFFAENALYWLSEFRFDGLRFDAAHQIDEQDWLPEAAALIREQIPRHVHLVLEHEGNIADWLGHPFDAQWNDDSHHVMHVLLTGEADGYYGDFTDQPAQRLARWLAEGFVYQGEISPANRSTPRGQPSGHLPTTAFINCLQNHDQIGNRALGERLTRLAQPEALRAAITLLLMCPQIPLVFMGEEDGSQAPFLYFASHEPELAKAVRDGRRKEFAHFPSFATPEAQARIPDPNDVATFENSRVGVSADGNGNGNGNSGAVAGHGQGGDGRASGAHAWRTLYRDLLTLRRRVLVPRLSGCSAMGADVLGPKAALARWGFDDGTTLTLLTNFDAHSVDVAEDVSASGEILVCVPQQASDAFRQGRLTGFTTIALLSAR